MTIQKPLRVYTLHYNHPSLEFELTMDHTPNLLGNNSLIHKNVCCFTKWQRIVKILWVSSKVWYSYQPPFPAGTFLHRRCTFVLCMPVSVSRKDLRIEVTRHLAGCLYFKRLSEFPPSATPQTLPTIVYVWMYRKEIVFVFASWQADPVPGGEQPCFEAMWSFSWVMNLQFTICNL